MAISNKEAAQIITDGQTIAANFIRDLAALEGWRLGIRTRSIGESTTTPKAVNVSNMLIGYLNNATPPWPGMTMQLFIQANDAIQAVGATLDAAGVFAGTTDTPKAARLLLLMLAKLAQE